MPPSGRNFLSSIAFSNLAWTLISISPISSRNSVPPSASSNNPGLLLTAPVKAPFAYPNSSDSINSFENPAQLSSTKLYRARPLKLWINLAQPFPGPCLAQDENRGIVLGKNLDQLIDPAKLFALAYIVT